MVDAPNPRIRTQHRRFPSQQGLSMIEVLVAVFIFAFGGMAAATMQILAAQANLEAMQRTQAVHLATDILERMRNNARALAQYDSAADADWTVLGNATRGSEPTPHCDTAACSSSERAAHDLWVWERALDGYDVERENGSPAGGLIRPTGCIRNTGNGRIELAVAWYGRRDKVNSHVATECTAEGRYGDADQFRRVLRFRTYITPL